MGERCMLLVHPSGDLDARLASADEYFGWQLCENPVVFRVNESLAPGGVLRLCEPHRLRLVKAGFKAEAQE
jgi:hypothetical protein